ncbi:transcriptional regulator [Leminorella grimontii]|uniref:Transcriptional regulator n=1 Tax=Leminorella grimontii TaxID=82981 RepID=A0AAV5N9V3_9GAMM|nr:MerR family transcriptional regulator [Leminorella grimontii]KFC93196.1 MerR family transcriptional regulator [Leminorella grimontii ATCC 33999 = DSM 5078]GKX57642.1 transcriptional regulator [Leminorella grimontii]GKX61328.1 transcriptional regulator [Leminorella grimontii]VFS55820.1 HTH-type transcriptional regulator AdhR [Leminorella grimontii]
MKIGTLAKKVGLTPHTLRYYERIGLLPPVYRDAGGQRDYDEVTLQRLEFLGKMRTTGMPLRQMRRYVSLVVLGDATIAERRALLEAHRDDVHARMLELENCLAVLDKKIEGYCSLPMSDTAGDPK